MVTRRAPGTPPKQKSSEKPGSEPLPIGKEGTRSGLIVLALYLFTAAYMIPIFPHGGSANEMSRWATAASIIEHRSFEISWSEALLGPNPDTAKLGPRIYSNKPPATAVLALPGYLAGRLFVGPPNASNIRLTWTLMRWCAATIPMMLFAYALLRRGADTIVMTVALFSTPLLLYSLLFFSHVLTAVALYGAYRLLFGSSGAPTAGRAILAGVWSGLAVCSEFPAAVAVAIFLVAVLLSSTQTASAKAWTALWFALGVLPFAAGLAVYNASVFGSPLELSYGHESFQQWAKVAQKGVFGIGWPDPRNLWMLLLSPSRGLFFYSPLLILSSLSLVRVTGKDAFRRRVRLAVVIAGIVLLSGHGAAHGGWAAGPRYILFVIPFLIEPFLEIDWFRIRPGLAGALLGASMVLSILPALTFPFVPPEIHAPHNTFWRPFLLAEGWATPTVGALAGLGSGLPALLPVLAALIAAFFFALRKAPLRLVVCFVLGIIVAAAYSLSPGLDDVDSALRRASIAERFFRPEGRLEPFRKLAKAPDQLRALDSMEWLVADTWPNAPDNWPYSRTSLPKEGPSAVQQRAAELQKQGRLEEATQVLSTARDEFPFARCNFTDLYAVALYLSDRKDEALAGLEEARPLTDESYSPGCLMALFHLGSLYSENNRRDEAAAMFRTYLERTEGDSTPATADVRERSRRELHRLSQTR